MNTVLPKPFAENYSPGAMTFSEGFSGPKGNVGFTMWYDHDLAKAVVVDLIESGADITEAVVGLDGDFIENSAIIYGADWLNIEHEPDFNDDPYFYDNSIWAEPTLVVTFKDGSNKAYRVWKKEENL